MKFNKWTVGLAAVGVVSLASAAKAEEKANLVQTALASTTLSGYVDTSAQWNPGTGNANNPAYRFGGPSKADGFNLNVVQLRLEKPLDEAEWAAGYRADLWAGPDANALGTQSFGGTGDFAVRQAYVSLRTPVLNGIDWKFGVFDSIIGYESIESPSNPNYTRSWGNSIEPTTHTGMLATYRFNEMISASAGIANTVNAAINSRATEGSSFVAGPMAGMWAPLYNSIAGKLNAATGAVPGDPDFATGADVRNAVGAGMAHAESYKAYMGSVAFTAPDSMGFLAGSTLYAGVVNGFNNSVMDSGVGNSQTSYYLGATLATPVTGLRTGVAIDWLRSDLDSSLGGSSAQIDVDSYSIALYASFQATEKLSVHARGEYFDTKMQAQTIVGSDESKAKIWSLTGTVQYDLWRNVLSRFEVRWDHGDNGHFFGGTVPGEPDAKNAWMLAANIIYKF